MKIYSLCQKILFSAVALMAFCNLLRANTNEFDSYDTLRLCQSAFPVYYDTLLITNAGDYEVSLASESGNDSLVHLHVIAYANPVPVILGDHGHCVNMPASVYVDDIYTSILWSTGSENYYTQTSDPWCAVQVVDENGCVGTDSVFFEIFPIPNITITGDTVLCYPDTVVLYAVGGSVYYWYDKQGLLSYEDSLSYMVSQQNIYIDTITILGFSDQGCLGRNDFHVRANIVFQSEDTVMLCENEFPFYFRDSVFAEPGTYPIHLQAQQGCDSVLMLTLALKDNPHVQIIGVDHVCEGVSTMLTASGASSYRWSTGAVGESIMAQAGHLYWLEGQDANGCVARDSIEVEELPLPLVSITGDETVAYGQSFTLTAHGGVHYLWSTGDTTAVLTMQAEDSATYQVTAYSDSGCMATATAFVCVNYETNFRVNCCVNELPYLYNGNSYMESGTYDILLTAMNGCDSLVHLQLTVNENPYAQINGITEVCPGASTQLSANGNGSFLWSTGANRSPITVNTPGWYTLTVTAANGCKAYDSVEVTSLPLPEVSISGVSSTCRGTSVELTASGASTYQWNTGMMGAVLQVMNPIQTSVYTVTGISDRGCSATASHSLTVNALPSPSITGVSAVCQGDTAVLTASGGLTYLWSTGDTTASVSLTEAQTYSVIVTDGNACTATTEKTLTVNSLPEVSIMGRPYICANGNTTLYAMGSGIMSYVWNDFRYGQSIVVTEAGTYTVEASSTSGCTSTASVMVEEFPNPQVFVSGDLTFCDGQNTVLTASGGQTYVWRNAYGTQLSNTAEVTLNESGSYLVTVTDTNACSSSQQVIINKKNLPSISILATSGEICEGDQVSLMTGWASGYSYLWSTGATERQITVNTGGTYILQVTANGCTAVDSVNIVSHPLPVIVIAGKHQLCKGDTGTLTANEWASYTWSTGDTSRSVSVSPGQSTVYELTVTDTNGCMSSDDFTIHVDELFQLVISGENAICDGDSTLLVASGWESVVWSNGQQGDSIVIYDTGDYTVDAVGTVPCVLPATYHVDKIVLPDVSIAGASSACQGDTLTLSAVSSQPVSYQWNTGSTAQTIRVTESGNYTVTVSNSQTCVNEASITVSVNPLPTVTIIGSSTVCAGSAVTLTASGTAADYHWSTGDTSAEITFYPTTSGTYQVTALNEFGCSATATEYVELASVYETNINVTCCSSELPYIYHGQPYTQDGVYEVHLMTIQGCDSVVYLHLTVNENPYAIISGDTKICQGENTRLYANANAGYSWNTGATTSYIDVSDTGWYVLTAEALNGCKAYDSVYVSYWPQPVVSVSGNLSFCDGENTLLTASGGVTYEWKNAFGVLISQEAEALLSESGVYMVTISDTNGCVASSQVTVMKKNLPSVYILASDNNVCEGTNVTLTTGWASGYSYLWNTGSTERQITVNTAGTYVLYVTANGCTAVDSTSISMYSLPSIEFTGDTLVCEGDTATIYAYAPDAVSYLWNTSSSENNISVTPLENTSYWVSVEDVRGCRNQDTFLLRLEDFSQVTVTGPDSICVGDSAILRVSGGASYLWDDNSTSAERVVYAEGTYTVMVFTAKGCMDTFQKSIAYYDMPNVRIEGGTHLCIGDSVLLTARGADSYVWYDMSTDTSITVSTPGVYAVEGWNAQGCHSRDSVEVSENALPTVQIVGNSSGCSNNVNLLTAVSPSAVSYLWNTAETASLIQANETAVYSVTVRDSNSCQASASFSFELKPAPACSILGKTEICIGDTTTLTASNGTAYFWSTGEISASIRVAPASTRNYSLVIMGANGCTSSASVQVVVRSATPIAIIGPDDFCVGDSVLLVAESDGNLVWSTGQSGDSIVVYDTGDYMVWSVDSNTCRKSSTKHVEKHVLPDVQIVGDSYVCVGDTALLQAVSSEPVSYQWTTGSTDSVIRVTSTNVYGVTVTNLFGCSNTTSKLLMAYSTPSVNINGPSSVCNGEDAVLNVTGNASRYQWSTGDTTPSITVNPSYTSTYQVVGFNSNGCHTTASFTLTVNPNPTVSITGDTLLCQGETTNLTCSNASSFLWSTGATGRSISISESGCYSVVATNTMGCANSASVYVRVFERPNLMILGDTMLCQGGQTELLAIGGDSYLWSNGSTEPSIVVSPEYSASYTVQAFNGECMSEMSRQVVVKENPVASIAAPEGICAGTSVTMTAQGGVAYLWSTGQTAAMIEVYSSGDYQLIAFGQNGCTDTVSHTLTLYPNPQLTITGTTALCQDEHGSLTAVGNGSFLWNTGDTTSSITVTAPTYYQVQLIDSNGCIAYANQNVTSLASPSIVISGTDNMCDNDSTTLAVFCTNTASFAWNTGASSSTITVSPVETTTYSVTAVSVDNCTAQQSHTVTVHPSYTADFSAEICVGHSYSGQGFEIPVQSESGIFDYTVTLPTAYGCDSVRILHLTVNPVPVISGSISGNTQVTSLGNYVYMIDPVENTTAYEWILSNPNWNVSFNQTVAQVSVLSPGMATLSVYALNECGQSQPVSIQITYGTGIDDMELSSVQVYPNPTNGIVNIQTTVNHEQMYSGEILLLDMYGKLLGRWNMTGEKMELDLSSYAAGVYLLKLRNSQNATESIVKLVKR